VVTVITDNGSGDTLPRASSPLSLTCIGRLTTTPEEQKKPSEVSSKDGRTGLIKVGTDRRNAIIASERRTEA